MRPHSSQTSHTGNVTTCEFINTQIPYVTQPIASENGYSLTSPSRGLCLRIYKMHSAAHLSLISILHASCIVITARLRRIPNVHYCGSRPYHANDDNMAQSSQYPATHLHKTAMASEYSSSSSSRTL